MRLFCCTMTNTFPADAPWFSLNGTRTVRVVSIHDGDTFTAIFRFDNAFYKFPVRLARIDTCEMTSKNTLLKTKAFLARDKMFELITGHKDTDTVMWRKREFDEYFQKNETYLTINCTEMDKYGRVLADVGTFAETLVEQKLAYWYDGGKKLTEDEIMRVVG